jgi:hypothetical protein
VAWVSGGQEVAASCSPRWYNMYHMVPIGPLVGGEVNMKIGFLTGGQIRAARAFLRWSAAELARASALGVNTVKRAELAEAKTSLTAANELAIRRALEAAGVEFTNGDQPGVRLRKGARPHSSEPANEKQTVSEGHARGARKR